MVSERVDPGPSQILTIGRIFEGVKSKNLSSVLIFVSRLMLLFPSCQYIDSPRKSLTQLLSCTREPGQECYPRMVK